MRRDAARAFLIVAAIAVPPAAAHAGAGPSPQFLGRWLVADGDVPAPGGTTEIPIEGGDFEAAEPPRWPAGGEVVEDADAPRGGHYGRIPARKGGILMTPAVEVVPGRPHLLSLWLRSPVAEWAAVGFRSDGRLSTFGDHYPGVPETGGRWRRLGFYVLAPADAEALTFQIQPMQERPEGPFIAVDDVRLRTATWEEMSDAYLAERAQWPPVDITPRPGDGRHLALSVAKWEGRAGLPGRPFVIWAIGSSWTNFQGDGYPLMRVIRERFPQAPPLVYRKHAGSGTPWDYARGWVEQFVAADSPDLVLTYTNGSPEGLDALLTALRRRTTADVIVPSLHFFEGSALTEEDVERGVVDWEAVRRICRRHDVEFVENRRELAAYLRRIGAGPKALLTDPVHQNQHGTTRIWDNIVRHIAHADEADGPGSRERLVRVASRAEGGRETVDVSDGWSKSDEKLRTGRAGASIRVRFVGNRIDLIGRKGRDGGTVRVRVDGVPADQAPAFAMNSILPEPAPGPPVLEGPGPGDVAPHAVGLGERIVPQTWTITMTSDVGDYRLAGSVTGPDGEGNSTRPFRSRSGQILIDPALWRHNRAERPDGTVLYGNRAGDRFSFAVERATTVEVCFRASKEEGSRFSVPLAWNLPNGTHTLEIVAVGDGAVVVEGLYVSEPPLTE
jgi:hypothetical protein